MIGKKAAIGIIAATGVVAVGVPVGIVVGQHASKTGSLDSKMQSKWSDIERELASSFGGFEIRDKDIVEQKQTQLSESEVATQKQKLLIQRITGVGVPAYDASDFEGKTAFYNNLVTEEKVIDQYISQFIDAYESIISKSANDYLYYHNSKITDRTTSEIGITLSTSLVDSKINVRAITLNNVTVSIPLEIDAFVEPEDDPSILAFDPMAVKVSLDKSKVRSYIYKSIADFKKLLDATIDDSNILEIEQNAKLLLAQLTDSNSPLNQLIGKGAIGQNISSAFGLKGILDEVVKDTSKDFHGQKASDLVNKINEITVALKKAVFETKLSLEGHHNQNINEKYMKNIDGFEVGKGFVSEKFQNGVLTPFTNNPDSLDKELLDNLPASEFGSIDISWFKATVIQGNLTEGIGGIEKQDIIIDNYISKWNATHSDTMFTNADAIQWQKESGNSTMNHTPVLGEGLVELGAAYRVNKIKNMNSSEWLFRLQYELIWNSQKFNSVVDKYNISLNDLYVDIDTNDAHQEISNNFDSTFKFNNVFLTPLVNAQNKPTLQSLYPLSSPEWVNAGYNIAQSTQAADIYVPGILATNALREFRLTQDTKITFRLKIENSEIGKIYENATNRKPLTFTLSKDGELSLDSRVGGNN